MNASNHNIEITCEAHHVKEAVQAILHSIVFFRCHGKFNYKHEGSYSIGTLGFEEVCCRYLELTYVRCSSSSLTNCVDTKIKEFVDRLLPTAQIQQPPTDANYITSYPSVSYAINSNTSPSSSSNRLQSNRVTNSPSLCNLSSGVLCGTIYLEFYSRRPSRWPFNESNITWEIWTLKVNVATPKNNFNKFNYNQLASSHKSSPHIMIGSLNDGQSGSGGSGNNDGPSSSPTKNQNEPPRVEQIISQKLMDIVQVINSDKYYLPQMPSQHHVNTVFDTNHIDSQPYLFKISFRIGDNPSTSSSAIKKFIRETMAL